MLLLLAGVNRFVSLLGLVAAVLREPTFISYVLAVIVIFIDLAKTFPISLFL